VNERPWFEKYVGLPFIDGGRDLTGVDCWGLVRLILRSEKNIDTPSYGEISAEDLMGIAGMVAQACRVEPWIEIHPKARSAFDVVVMRRAREPVHLGILAEQSRLLHIERKTDSVLIPIDHRSVEQRIIGYFRHRTLLNAT